jgi:hypothetical protein
VPSYNTVNGLHLTIAGTGYTGVLSGLTLTPGTAPAWSITGGMQAVTLSGTVSAGFSRAGLLSDTSLTLNDSSDGLSATLTSSHGGRLTGSITNASGQTVGTIALDLSGSGQVSYSDGTTAQGLGHSLAERTLVKRLRTGARMQATSNLRGSHAYSQAPARANPYHGKGVVA